MTPHHEALFRNVLSRAETAEGQLVDLQQQIEQARQQCNALLQVQSRGYLMILLLHSRALVPPPNPAPSRALSLFILRSFFSHFIATVQGERAESARLLVELQQAREQINVLMQVLSHCLTVVRTLSRDFLNVFPLPPPLASTPSLRCCFFWLYCLCRTLDPLSFQQPPLVFAFKATLPCLFLVSFFSFFSLHTQS